MTPLPIICIAMYGKVKTMKTKLTSNESVFEP